MPSTFYYYLKYDLCAVDWMVSLHLTRTATADWRMCNRRERVTSLQYVGVHHKPVGSLWAAVSPVARPPVKLFFFTRDHWGQSAYGVLPYITGLITFQSFLIQKYFSRQDFMFWRKRSSVEVTHTHTHVRIHKQIDIYMKIDIHHSAKSSEAIAWQQRHLWSSNHMISCIQTS